MEVKVFPLRIEGIGKPKFVGAAGISLDTEINLNSILSTCRKLSLRYNVVFQVVNHRVVASLRHLLSSVMRAIRAFNENRNICDKVEIEILLYVSGRRQIRDALKIAGLPESARDFISICIGDDWDSVLKATSMLVEHLDGRLNWDLFRLNAEKISFLRSIFSIGDDELNAILRRNLSLEDAVERLVIERCALLDIVK